VVYRGMPVNPDSSSALSAYCCTGREVSTGRRVAIKKIKVGQFKDGLDMSAIREVKYLRELHHSNVIEVRLHATLCLVNYVVDSASSFWMCFHPKRI
jgi:hypothetical protein